MQHITWRKSTRSGAVGNCVEVASTLHLLRDSKNPTGPSLAVDVSALIEACRRRY
jgi:hypothetical protein